MILQGQLILTQGPLGHAQVIVEHTHAVRAFVDSYCLLEVVDRPLRLADFVKV